MNELNNNLNINQDDMLNRESEIDMNNSQNYNHTNNEELIDAYIGKGAEKIRKGKFSLWTCFFGTAYVFYRKMWLLGLVWYLINIFIALTAAFITLKVFNIVELLQSSTYSITTIVVFVSSCIVNIIISFLFKKLYIKKSEKKVEKIKQKNSNKTNEELKKICAKKGGTTIIGIVVAILLSGVVETICEPIVEKIVSNEIHNKFAKETAYSIISEVEYAYTQAFLTSGKDTLILEDIKNEYNGLSSTWNKDNTITSKHYDVVCNVTVNNDNKIQVSCDVLGEKIESELLDLNIGNKGNNQANNNQNNGNSNNIDILKENGKNNILSSNNDCINNNTKCENGTVVNVKVNDKQEYRFYVINDTGMHLTLIMDGNLGGNVSWFDEGQEEIKTTSSGPITVIEALKERTNEWTNIPKKDYTYSDDGGSSKYSMFSENMRVRMLTVTEGKSLGCDYKLNSCPKYLYSAENGYWTSSATSASDNIGEAIYVTNEGGLSQLLVNYPTICGIRPVIEITK